MVLDGQQVYEACVLAFHAGFVPVEQFLRLPFDGRTIQSGDGDDEQLRLVLT